MASDYQEPITTETISDVLVVRLNRPEVLNALTSELLEQLGNAVTKAGEDDGIRAVILTGAGRAFCSGEDLNIASVASGAQFDAFIDKLQELTRQLLDFEKPLLAALNGPAVGGGAELAIACDVRIASSSASFQMPEAELGIVVTGGTLFLLGQIVGRGRATELLMTGRTVTADQAEEMGLVSACVSDDDLLSEATGLAQRLGGIPGAAMRELKRGLRALDRDAVEQSMEIETAVSARLFADPVSREQALGFVNKRSEPTS